MLTFEIFNYNVHNSLVDSSASLNVIPLSIANKINTKWDNTNEQVIYLDNTIIRAIGEIINVLTFLSSDEQFHECINILIVDIRE